MYKRQPQDKLIILCMHIPVFDHTINAQELLNILGSRNVHMMTGHTHFNKNVIRNNFYEHNHGTVCGAWWTGNICGDGTPNGYGIYEVQGNKLVWQYKSTGQNHDYQMSMHATDPGMNGERTLQVNIWNYDEAWTTALFVDGAPAAPLQQYEGYDPVAYEKMLGPDKPKPRSFAEPVLNNHMFRATLPAGARHVRVEATDRFGNKYTSCLLYTSPSPRD